MFISALFCPETDGTEILLPKCFSLKTHIFAVETPVYLGPVALTPNSVKLLEPQNCFKICSFIKPFPIYHLQGNSLSLTDQDLILLANSYQGVQSKVCKVSYAGRAAL